MGKSVPLSKLTFFQSNNFKKENCLTISPPIFEYNSKIGIHDTVVPEKLKEIVNYLQTNGTEKKELIRMELVENEN